MSPHPTRGGGEDSSLITHYSSLGGAALAVTPTASVTVVAPIRGRGVWLRSLVGRVALHGLLVALSIVALVPIAWMLSTSLKASGTEYEWPIRWIPDQIVFGNYVKALTIMNFAAY